MSEFSDDEREAMKQRAAELRATKGLKGAAKTAKELEDCMKAIDALSGLDQKIATMLHRVVMDVAPELAPKTWYGFPTYAKDGKNIVFFQPAQKFKARYGTIGFDENAKLDDGPMWPAAYAVVEVTDAVEKELRRLVKKAAA